MQGRKEGVGHLARVHVGTTRACLTAFASSLLSRSPISPSLFGADANRVNGCACESEGRREGGRASAGVNE